MFFPTMLYYCHVLWVHFPTFSQEELTNALNVLQEDFTLMMSGTLQRAASNVLMDLLFSLAKRLEHQGTIASPVQKGQKLIPSLDIVLANV